MVQLMCCEILSNPEDNQNLVLVSCEKDLLTDYWL